MKQRNSSMGRWGLLFAALAVCGCFTLALRDGDAQATPQAVSVAQADKVGLSPVTGLNFSLSELGQHNSATGWADIVTPNLAYRFNHHFLLNASVPWYPTVKSFVPVTVNGTRTTELENGKNLLGDAGVAANFEASHHNFNYLATTAVDFPTGNVRYGLGANQVTYNINNHFDYQLGPFDPEIEIGEGDNSSLANTAARKAYVAVGPIANFSVGTSIDLPLNLNLDLEAYEDLPLGNQNVYGTVTRKGRNGRTRSVQVLEGTGVAEDNGFNAELDLPVGNHFVLMGLYERSLIQSLDTASVGITWTLRAPKVR